MKAKVKAYAERLAFKLLGVSSVVELAGKRLNSDEVHVLAESKLSQGDIAWLARRSLKGAVALDTAEKILKIDDAKVVIGRLSGFDTFEDYARRVVLGSDHILGTTREYIQRLIAKGSTRIPPRIEFVFEELVGLTYWVEANEKGFMKKHSKVLAKVKSDMPLLSKSDCRLVVELLVLYVKRTRLGE